MNYFANWDKKIWPVEKMKQNWGTSRSINLQVENIREMPLIGTAKAMAGQNSVACRAPSTKVQSRFPHGLKTKDCFVLWALSMRKLKCSARRLWPAIKTFIVMMTYWSESIELHLFCDKLLLHSILTEPQKQFHFHALQGYGKVVHLF